MMLHTEVIPKTHEKKSKEESLLNAHQFLDNICREHGYDRDTCRHYFMAPFIRATRELREMGMRQESTYIMDVAAAFFNWEFGILEKRELRRQEAERKSETEADEAESRANPTVSAETERAVKKNLQAAFLDWMNYDNNKRMRQNTGTECGAYGNSLEKQGDVWKRVGTMAGEGIVEDTLTQDQVDSIHD